MVKRPCGWCGQKFDKTELFGVRVEKYTPEQVLEIKHYLLCRVCMESIGTQRSITKSLTLPPNGQDDNG